MATTAFTADEQQAIEEKGFVLRMVCLPSVLVGVTFLAYPWPSNTLPVILFWTCFTAYSLFCWTSCFHETAHQTLTTWSRLDIAIGRILGTLIFVPYTAYRESHIRHHAYLNRPNDWELWPYSDPSCSKTFRRVFVFFDIALGFVISPYIYGRIFFHKNSPLNNPAVRRTITFEYLAIAVFWGLIFFRLAYAHTWMRYLQIWLIPHMIAGVLQTLRKLTEHLGMKSYDPMLGTRTVVGSNPVTRIGSFMNFEIFVHGPHHRHPRLAQNLLKSKMDEYIVQNPGTNYPVYGSYLQATRAMLPYLFVNPGIGVNAGAAAPNEARIGDADNFPSDVVQEIH